MLSSYNGVRVSCRHGSRAFFVVRCGGKEVWLAETSLSASSPLLVLKLLLSCCSLSSLLQGDARKEDDDDDERSWHNDDDGGDDDVQSDGDVVDVDEGNPSGRSVWTCRGETCYGFPGCESR